MRRRAKIDRNHPEIVEALRKFGASVRSIAAVGNGCPDLLVGFAGRNLLLEVKDGAAVPSAQKLTDDEKVFHLLWRGQVCIVTSIDEALKLLGVVGSEG